MCIYVKGQPFIPAPNTARVRMTYSYLGQVIENVWFFEGDAPLIAADLSGLVDSVHNAWVAQMKNVLCNQVVLLTIEATALDAEVAPQVELVVAEAGTIDSPGLPGNATFALKFSTGLAGRSSRGRMFWPGLAESQVAGNQVTDAAVGLFVPRMNALFDAVTTDTGLRHVVTSYCHNKAWRAIAVNTPVLSVVATDHNIDSQRRRLAGRGI